MHDILSHIRQAFILKWKSISNDCDEIRRRLARRSLPSLARPLRAWCIAIKATDRRIESFAASHVHEPYAIQDKASHYVRVDVPFLRLLTAPVWTDSPGVDPTLLAPKLGTTAMNLYTQRRRGLYQEHRIARLGGKRGKPVPLIFKRRPLDPCAYGYRAPDTIWGDEWMWRSRLLRDDFSQTLTRHYQTTHRFPRWWWECPGCHAQARTLYCPVPVQSILCDLDLHLPDGQEINLPLPLSTFACRRCHQVQDISRADQNGWNVFVSFATTGLLFGSEVPRPKDWTIRINKKHKKPHARPALRRAQVCDLLTDTDLTRNQIAAKLGLSRGTINMHVEDAFKQYAVHSREDLRNRVRLMRAKTTSHPNQNAAVA